MGSQSERQAEYFQFLNELRESGITNMFGAARYLEDKFPELSRQEATTELSAWMKSFDKKDAEEEMPTVAAAWKRHWDDRDSAELAKAEAEATTAPPVVDRADKFLADLLAILEQTRH